MERLPMVARPGAIYRFSDQQVARRSTWGKVPDEQMTFAALHTIHQVPYRHSTITYINPLDPGDGGWHDNTDKGWDSVHPAGLMR